MRKISTKPHERLRILRMLRNLTQFKLQQISGVSHSTICMIERGIRRPTERQKKRLAVALGVDAKAIFPKEED